MQPDYRPSVLARMQAIDLCHRQQFAKSVDVFSVIWVLMWAGFFGVMVLSSR